MSTWTGVNISQWNGSVDFSKLDAKFALLKVGGSDGGQYNDYKYPAFAKAARAAGIPIGHYWYNGEGDAVSDADRFSASLKEFHDGDLCILDIEASPNDPATGWAPDKALAFIKRLKANRPTARVTVYMSSYVTRTQDWTEVAKLAWLWVAGWGADDGTVPTDKPNIKYWTNWIVWQYTQQGNVAGISGTVDLNLADSSIFTSPTSAEPPVAPPDPATVKPEQALATASTGVPDTAFYKRLQWYAHLHGYTGPLDGALGILSWKGIQKGLATSYGYTGTIDGVPGSLTYKALQRMGATSGYTGPIDGDLGVNSYKAIAKKLNTL